ncbi:type I glyceraldehyde-3-phosphate dehydrogenase [bacterium]|nr:type I glyceraldehyde-3-phosphate dehydrogenase [bacterium]
MSKKINVAINGFGRIGRAVFKIILDKYPNMNIVAINDLSDPKNLAYLLKHDSVYKTYDGVKLVGKTLKTKNSSTKIFSEREPENLPWKELAVDIVLECTGIFRNTEGASKHLKAGAKKVVISAPTKSPEEIKTIVFGVNHKKITKKDNILSCASCTTNCLAPVSKIVKDSFGIKKSVMTTIHAYTASQNIVDGSHKDFRRGRAGALNLVPTTTGAAKATTLVIPELKNKIDGVAVRVPIPVGSIIDVTYLLKKKTDKEKVISLLKKASKKSDYKNIVLASDEELVSSDIVGSNYSSIIDLNSTQLIDGDLLKLMVWYDNEWGYSVRLADLANLVSKKYL